MEEALPAKLARDSGAPTKAEYGRHVITHMPYRAFCPWCAAGRGRSSQHRRVLQEQERRVPLVAVDVCVILGGVHQYCASSARRQEQQRHTL